jgi:hypothetical protein
LPINWKAATADKILDINEIIDQPIIEEQEEESEECLQLIAENEFTDVQDFYSFTSVCPINALCDGHWSNFIDSYYEIT